MTGGIQWSGIVMIAPPNQGSVVARQISSLPGMGKLFQYVGYNCLQKLLQCVPLHALQPQLPCSKHVMLCARQVARMSGQ